MDIRALRDYALMMSDHTRMLAFEEAIAATCRDAVVCEIGVGLGPLSLMALKAGAKRVYGIELDPRALRKAMELIAHNGFGPKVFIPFVGLSTEVELPERVDVVLSETLDSMGVGENTVHYMADARQRFLKPGGHMLPLSLECFFALASPASFSRMQSVWTEMSAYGLDYGPLVRNVRAVKHTLPIANRELASDWQAWQAIDFATTRGLPAVLPMVLEATRSGRIEGLASAFRATLSPDVHLSTFPQDAPTHWQQGFSPFPSHPIDVVAGELVYIELQPRARPDPSLGWEMIVAHGPPEQVEKFLQQRHQNMRHKATG